MAYFMFIGTIVLIPIIYALEKEFSVLWKLTSDRRALLRQFPLADGYHWLFGHLKDFPGLTEEGLEWLSKMTAKFPRYYIFALGPKAQLELNHPDTIKQLTKTAEPKQFSYGGGYNAIKPWIGDGLLCSSGRKWARNRKLLTPGFHFEVLKPYVDVYNDSVEKMLEIFDRESAQKKQSIEIFKRIGECALDVILRCAFSANLHDKREKDAYVKTVNELTRQVFSRTLQPLLYLDAVYYATSEGRKFRKNCQYSHKVANDVIQKRREELKDAKTIEALSNKRYVEFLDILLLAKDEDGNGLTHQEIMDEVETFMVEGHDTMSSGMSWILYNLARHPEIQATAQAEVDALLEGRHTDRLTWKDMSELPYLTRCIKESLRLHTAVPIIGRELTKPLKIDGKIIPAGSMVDINIWNLHHNLTVWENPMTYDPDRFLPENISKIDSHAFLPFAAGPRNCIGQNFAMNEMKTTVARVLRQFHLTVDTSKELKLQPDLVLRSKSGIHLFFTSWK